jgi:Flp pilus assembly protein TadB
MADRTGVIYTDSDGHHTEIHTSSDRSMSDIIRDLMADVQNIVRGEMRLAKVEIKEKAQQAGQAGGLFGGAAVCGIFAGACLVVTCIAALALAMPVWLAALVMAVCLGCTAWGLFLGGRNSIKQVNPVPERTVETLKDDVEWAKHRTR